MTFNASLSDPQKLRSLRHLLQSTCDAKGTQAAPKSLHDADYKAWQNLKWGLSTVEHYLEDYPEEEVILREMYENGPRGPWGAKDMSALHQLSGLMELMGRYAEAEEMAREVLRWLEGQELLGPESPQALGCMRCLARSIWKQGRHEEAWGWTKICRGAVEEMKRGRFAKYQENERLELESDVEALKSGKWN